MRVIKQLTPYIPAAQIFSLFAHEKDCAFLDSSLVNQLDAIRFSDYIRTYS